MHCEIPVLTRCCFCLPLRGGILAYAYIKMVSLMIVTALVCIQIFRREQELADIEGSSYVNRFSGFECVYIVVLTVDIAMVAVLIIGGHTTNTSSALKLYMWYSVVGIILQLLANLFLIVVTNSDIPISMAALSLIVGVYSTICIRSEIVKRERSEVSDVEPNILYTSSNFKKFILTNV